MDGSARNAVCLCADGRMLIPALFVANAVRRAAVARRPGFDIVIFTPRDEVTDDHRKWAADRGISFNHEVLASAIQDIKILQRRRFSTATVMKLLVPGHLAGRYRKVLLLDADLTIHNDVSNLFRLEMGNTALAAVPAARVPAAEPPDEWAWWETHFASLGMTFPYRYFNVGIMLIDTENWVRSELAERALAFIRRNESICYFPEEDALNAVLDGDLIELSPIWNMRPRPLFDLRKLINPVIVHHAGPAKPWKRFGRNKRLFHPGDGYRLYQAFVRETPWPEWLSTQWTRTDLVASIRFEAKSLFGVLSDGRPIDAILRKHFKEAKFADVDQGIAVRNNGVLSLATGAA